MSEIPEPWRTAAERAGIRQTYRGIADAAGVSHVTVSRLIRQGRTGPDTVAAVARALRVPVSQVRDWAGMVTTELGPWVPPESAQYLTPRARAALDELVRVMTEGGSDAGQAEAEKNAGKSGGTGVTQLPSFDPDVHAPQAARRTGRSKDDGEGQV